MHDIWYLPRVRISALAFISGLVPLVVGLYPCNQTFANANATGFSSVDFGLANSTGPLPPLKLAVTVAQPPENGTNIVWAAIWGDTQGVNYNNDVGLLQDMCAFTFGGATENTVERAQTDNGDCLATFDQACVDAITTAAANITQNLVSPNSGPPNATVNGHLDSTCRLIAHQLDPVLQSAPECSNFLFQNSSTAIVEANDLTSPNTTTNAGIYNTSCTLNDNNDKYYEIFQLGLIPTGGNFNKAYDDLVTDVYPLLFVSMPLVNYTDQQQGSLPQAKADVRCLRLQDISPGSRVPSALPSPTPVGQSSALSGGAIAGIVICVVVVIVAIALLAIFLLRRRRRKRLQEATYHAPNDDHDDHASPPGDIEPPVMSERFEKRVDSAPLSELSDENALKPELDSVPKNELHAVEATERAELDGRRPLVELPGTIPSVMEGEKK